MRQLAAGRRKEMRGRGRALLQMRSHFEAGMLRYRALS